MKGLWYDSKLYAVISAFVQFMQSFYGRRLQEVNRSVAEKVHPLFSPFYLEAA